MKKMMFLWLAVWSLSTTGFLQAQESAASAKSSITTQNEQKTPVEVYYFHATRRCATCEAVEAVAAETVKENFDGKVSFQSINREENENHPLIISQKITGQTLLIVKGDQIIDLTTEAFLNARSKPEKLKAKIVETVNELLK